MTKKERTIKAFETIKNEYLNDGHSLETKKCALCIIHRAKNSKLCKGCPLAIEQKDNIVFFKFVGCISFKTFPKDRSINKCIKSNLRGAFYEIALRLIRQINSKYFTENGFRPNMFSKLLKIDLTLHENHSWLETNKKQLTESKSLTND